MNRYGYHCIADTWSDVIAWTAPLWKKKEPQQQIPRICLATVVYYIWKETNDRIFRKGAKTKEGLLKEISTIISAQIEIRWKQDVILDSILASWN